MQDSLRVLRFSASVLKIHIFARVLLIGGFCAVPLTAESVSAQQSTLQQTIRPIECVYTSTQTGNGTVQDSTCEGQPVPSVTTIVVNGGRPVLEGGFSSQRADTLKVWINGQWYTHKVDGRLSVEGDEWRLNLSGLNAPLLPGGYTVMVESQVDGRLLLRNTDAARFEVVATPTAPPLRHAVSENFVAPFFTSLIIPQTQEAMTEDGTPVPSSPRVAPSSQHIDRDASSQVAGLNFQMTVVVFAGALALVGVVGGVLYYSLRKM